MGRVKLMGWGERERVNERERERGVFKKNEKKTKNRVQIVFCFFSLSSRKLLKCGAFSRREYGAAFPSSDGLAQRELCFLPLQLKRATNAGRLARKASAMT